MDVPASVKSSSAISHFWTCAQQEVFSYGEHCPQLGTFVTFQSHVTVMWHCILNPEIQLSSYTLTREHHLHVRALLNSSLRAHSAQQLTRFLFVVLRITRLSANSKWFGFSIGMYVTWQPSFDPIHLQLHCSWWYKELRSSNRILEVQ